MRRRLHILMLLVLTVLVLWSRPTVTKAAAPTNIEEEYSGPQEYPVLRQIFIYSYINETEYYRIIPDRTDRFLFKENGDIRATIQILDSNGDPMTPVAEAEGNLHGEISIQLTKGKTYYLLMKWQACPGKYACFEYEPERLVDGETMSSKINITMQYAGYTIPEDQTAYLSVTAENAVGYQWMYRDILEENPVWRNVEGLPSAQKSALRITGTPENGHRQFRCKLIDSTGAVCYSDVCKITVVKRAKITSQPESILGGPGTKATFRMETADANEIWWESKAPGGSWTRVTDSTADGETLTVQVTESNKDIIYRGAAVGDSGETIYTDVVGAFMPEEMTTEPISTRKGYSETICLQDSRIQSVQWYGSNDGCETWNPVTSTDEGTDLTFLFGHDDAGMYVDYYCEFTTVQGLKLRTNVVHIIRMVEIIDSSPYQVSAKIGDTVTFYIEAEGAVSYQWRYRTEAGAAWKNSTRSCAKTPTFTFKLSSTNAKYAYQCVCTDEAGHKFSTPEFSVKVRYPAPTITALTNLSGGMKITWDAVDNAPGYCLQYANSKSGPWYFLKTTTSTSYTNTQVVDYPSGKVYYYRVCVLNNAEEVSDYSSVKSKTFLSTLGKDNWSISNLSAGVKLSWDAVEGAQGYYIYRKTATGTTYSKIATITDPKTLTYTDSGRTNGNTYYYRIRAYKGTTLAYYYSKKFTRLSSSAITSLTNSSTGKMKVEWAANTKATGYQIQYSTGSSFSSGTYTTVSVTSSFTLSKTISDLTKGKTYYVRVRSYKIVDDTKYYSGWSAKKSVKIAK